jgi:hypothetical protein
VARELRTIKQIVVERPYATERWLRRCVAERRFPHYKLAGKIFIDLDELDAYMETGRIEPPARRMRVVRGER